MLCLRSFNCLTSSSAISMPPSQASSLDLLVSAVVSFESPKPEMDDIELKSIAAVFEFRLWNLRRLNGGSAKSCFATLPSKLTRLLCSMSSANFVCNERRPLRLEDIMEAKEYSPANDFVVFGRSNVFAGDCLIVSSPLELVGRVRSAVRLRVMISDVAILGREEGKERKERKER
jgi:hypothetical protein